MKHDTRTRDTRTRENLIFGGTMLAVVVLFPVLGVLAFTLRAGIFAGLLAAFLVGLAVYAVSPRFRAWLGLQVDPRPVVYSGLTLAPQVALSPAHAWARIDGGEVTVGADDLMQSVLGPVDHVDLPPVDSRVRRGESLFRLHHGGRSVDVASPVSGTVIHTHDGLVYDPQSINRSPFEEGWAVRLQGEGLRREKRDLLRGDAARTWFRGEVDRLLTSLIPAGAVPTLPDGGVLVSDLHRAIDEPTWARVCDEFFTAPAVDDDEL